MKKRLMNKKGYLRAILTFLLILFVGAVIWWVIGQIALFPTTISAKYVRKPNSNLYSVESEIINIGENNMKDVNFHFEYEKCFNYFINVKTISNNEIINCRVNNNYQSLNIHCERLNVDDGFAIYWETDEEPKECLLKIKYDPIPFITSFFQLRNSARFYDFTRFEKEENKKINFTGMKIENMRPIRERFYSGGESVIKYDLLSSDNYNFTITTEWFNSTSYLSKWSNISTINANTQWTWYSWKPHSISLDSEYHKLRVIVRYGKEAKESSVNFYVIRNDEVLPYLQQNEFCKMGHDEMLFAINKIGSSKLKTEKEQSSFLLNLTRNIMVDPIETEKKEFYENNRIDSLTVFNVTEGTSSEFVDVYCMFLKSIGIPARVKTIDDKYFCLEVYIDKEGWLKTDPYDSTMKFGEWSANCEAI